MRQRPSPLHGIQNTIRRTENLIHLLQAAPRRLREQVINSRSHRHIETRKDQEIPLAHGIERKGRHIGNRDTEQPRNTDADAVDCRA